MNSSDLIRAVLDFDPIAAAEHIVGMDYLDCATS